ncbi:MAG: hypothetical protein RMJ56_13960 [Gemmataceae bacterium]|nr:hypothetical protein [Gemmata sp.]MDW8198697.1 hypothetical protein [Gemmataceae bacterium]
MALEFECPTCQGVLQVGEDMAGRVIRCGGCLSTLRVPQVSAATQIPPTLPEESLPPLHSRRTESTVTEPLPALPATPAQPSGRREWELINTDDVSQRDVSQRDDQESAPRDDRFRRFRHEPSTAPANSRGIFFWLVVIGFILSILVIGCCGGILFLLPDADWQWHESKVGGFKVKLPGPPQANVEDAVGIRLDKGTYAEGTVYLKRAETFMVIYRDIPSTAERRQRNKTDDDELAETIDRLLKATADGKQPRRKPVTVNGFPGYDLSYQGRSGWYTARVVVADTRRYIVLAVGPRANSSHAREFINSFAITDPRLVAEGQRRQNQAPPDTDENNANRE